MDAHGLALDHLHARGRIRDRAVTYRLGMDEGFVTEIEQVIDEKPVVGVHVVIAFGDRPIGIVHPVKIGDERGVGQRWLAHPDPHERVLLVHRIDPHARLGRDRVLAGNVDAGAGRVEAQAMIAALDDIAIEAPERQRDITVRTAILHRDDLARLRPEEDHPFAEQAALEQAVQNLGRVGGDLPAVGHEHRGHSHGNT